MSFTGKSFQSPAKSASASFTMSSPSVQTYAQFQATRQEKINYLSNDIKAQKEKQIQALQTQLQELMLEVHTTQSELSTEQHEFLGKKASLVTVLQKIKTDAEKKSSEARTEYLKQLEELENKRTNMIKELTESIPLLPDPVENEDNPQIEMSKSKLKECQNTLRQFKQQSLVNDQSNDDLDDVNLYNEKIVELEAQKRELIEELKENENNNKTRITDFTYAIDDQDSQFQNELENMQKSLQQHEEEYQNDLDKLFGEIAKIQEQHFSVTSRQKDRIKKLQAQIKKIESEFRIRMNDANRVAAKLQTALVTANLGKSHQIQLEKQRSIEQQKIIQDNFILQQRVAMLQNELTAAKEQAGLIRRELSGKIGPRRTASLFL